MEIYMSSLLLQIVCRGLRNSNGVQMMACEEGGRGGEIRVVGRVEKLFCVLRGNLVKNLHCIVATHLIQNYRMFDKVQYQVELTLTA